MHGNSLKSLISYLNFKIPTKILVRSWKKIKNIFLQKIDPNLVVKSFSYNLLKPVAPNVWNTLYACTGKI